MVRVVVDRNGTENNRASSIDRKLVNRQRIGIATAGTNYYLVANLTHSNIVYMPEFPYFRPMCLVSCLVSIRKN